MKVPVKICETDFPGVKLGIVRLGRAAGKAKYTLLNEVDITLVQDYQFEVKVIIDKNGSGACIYAWARAIGAKKHNKFLHELLWELRYGGIAPGFKVIHKNGITVDNRLDNLCLVPEDFHGPYPIDAQAKQREQIMYWAAVLELPPEHVLEQHEIDVIGGKSNTDLARDHDEVIYYECHYLPCTNIEQQPRTFSICGRCQEARYCGILCQQQDWAIHKAFCHEKPRPYFPEKYPDR